MKKRFWGLTIIMVLLSCFGCGEKAEKVFNATKYGVSESNSGIENSRALQALIDDVAKEGGTVYIPEGEYELAENGRQTIGSHCIKMRSGVNIFGDGEGTVLKPVGVSRYGLDAFYFNDYLDAGEAVYLENCQFKNFVIDGEGTSCEVYTSAGKGFMFNLFQNCRFERVIVKNTDATGFGVDCPIDGVIVDCVAVGCGKAANKDSGGASGFGIGFGYAKQENILIENCYAENNKKFGFFLEHQGRFNAEKYGAEATGNFCVKNCFAVGNSFGFGGICASNTQYENCRSEGAAEYGVLFENSSSSKVVDCQCEGAGKAAFAVKQVGVYAVSEISFVRCVGKNAPAGVELASAEADLQDCFFERVKEEIVRTGSQ